MIIYNVTVKVDHQVKDDWIRWMREKHIPDVLGTGLFNGHKFLKLMGHDDGQGMTFAIQYFLGSMKNYEEYQQKYAPKFQKEHFDRYQEKCVAFRTLLREL